MSNLAVLHKIEINTIAQLKSIRAQIKALQALEEQTKSDINLLLDSAGIEELVIGNDKVLRTVTERTSFDTKAFKEAHHDLYNKYSKKNAIITLKTL